MLALLALLAASITLTPGMLAIIVTIIPVIGAVWVGRHGTKRDLAEITLKVDGRLDDALSKLGIALTKVDALEQVVSGFTGRKAPPTVAGGSPIVPSRVIAS